ncbi:MAG: penicillin-binding transpeptidase domain-containing protein [Finegoldia sp.]|nr:penicillin-binding transpeptidase domain-containing protein [Finegoldia sp.]
MNRNLKGNKINHFKHKYNSNIVLMFIILFIIILFILLKLLYLQFSPGGDKYRKFSAQQVNDVVEVNGDRGKILDSKGNALAENVKSNNLYINSSNIKDEEVDQLVNLLYSKLNLNRQELKKQVEEHKTSLVKKSLSQDEIKYLESVDEKFSKYISLIPETIRNYPNNNSLSSTIGFCNLNLDGVTGLESYYNKDLKGEKGKKFLGSSLESLGNSSEDKAYITNPKPGNNLNTSIDLTIQGFVDEAVEDLVNDFKPKSVNIIVSNPNNGEILAAQSYPSFNNNDPKNINEIKAPADQLSEDKIDYNEIWKNRSISQTYEPGSVFKTITSASAIEDSAANDKSEYYCNGFITDIPGVIIRCESWANPHGQQTFQEAFNNSCNTSYVKIARALGKENFTKYINGFGFGKTTGIDLPAEEIGIAPKNTGEIDQARLATLSYGHGISVTPMEMVKALNAVINGGYMINPHIVKSITDPEGNLIEDLSQSPSKQVISSQSSQKMLKMLEGVVEDGSARSTKVPGYGIGAKTGTTIKLVDGEYTDDLTVATFFSAFPIDRPEYSIYIVVDEPQRKSGGAVVCGPTSKKIINNIINYKNIPQDRKIDENVQKVEVPDVVGYQLDKAVEILEESGLNSSLINMGTDKTKVVKSQEIDPYTSVEKGSIVGLETEDSSKTSFKMPDLVGFKLEDAKDLLSEYPINDIKVVGKGEGSVVKTNPEEGALIDPNSNVEIFLEDKKD